MKERKKMRIAIIAAVTGVVLLLVGVLWIAWYLISPIWRTVELDEPSPVIDAAEVEMRANEENPVQAEVIVKANLAPKAHAVEGDVVLIRDVDGSFLVRFEDFETINGPDLRIYLSDDLNDDDIVSLGPIKATIGNANYPVPVGTDLLKYDKVLVWCEDFSVLFSYGDFNLESRDFEGSR